MIELGGGTVDGCASSRQERIYAEGYEDVAAPAFRT